MLRTALLLALLQVFFLFNSLNVKAEELIALKKERVNPQRLEKHLLKRNIYFKNKADLESSDLSFDILKIETGANLDSVVNDLNKTGLFKLVEPNYKLYPDNEIVSKPAKKTLQYYLDQIKVPNAWIFSKGSGNIPIAVLDSGIDYLNKDLAERILPCISVLEGSYSCEDKFGHGTQVASIIASKVDNNLGLAGISWLNPILPIQVSNEEGIATVETVVKGLDYAIKSKSKIAVISLSTDVKSEILGLAIKEAYQKGILIIASGGNTGKSEIRYPAGFDEVIGVGSVNSNLEKSVFSTTGPHIKLVAPGEGIILPVLSSKEKEDSNYFDEVSGTSFTAPQVAGVAALVWALRPNYENTDIKKILFSSVKDLGKAGYDTSFGYGQIDAEVAVKRVLLKYEKREK